jgi:Na+-translocating ferredoxin:NAD+ oxidoreductase RnfD subunit
MLDLLTSMPTQSGVAGDSDRILLRPEIGRRNRVWLVGAMFPAMAGLALYGWRGALTAATVMVSAAIGAAFWRQVGVRGSGLSMRQTVALGGLLALMLPADLMNDFRAKQFESVWMHRWTIAPAAGLLLAMCLWLLGGVGLKRVHPLLLAYLALVGLFSQTLRPTAVLNLGALGVGDLADGTQVEPSDQAWNAQDSRRLPASAALHETTAADRLGSYTRGRPLDADWFSVDALLRDAMPPLENLVIGGHPGGLGTSSAIAVLAGGLLMLHRRAFGLRVPLLFVLTSFLCFLILPVPATVTTQGPLWRPLAWPMAHTDLATAVTFANYELMASPLLFTAFFLAPLNGICPVGKPARLGFAFVLGVLCATAQLYASVAFGPYMALAAAGLLGPTLDEVHG